VDKNLLELWGQTLLGMAKISEGVQNFYNLFDSGFAKKEQKLSASQEEFVKLCQRSFGAEGIETFNSILKEFYENVGVVPRAEYNALQAKYLDLKKRVQDLEEKIKSLKQRLKTGSSTPSDLMEQWTETAETYAEINQQFFKEFSKFFK
jgi:hypothetical protein